MFTRANRYSACPVLYFVAVTLVPDYVLAQVNPTAVEEQGTPQPSVWRPWTWPALTSSWRFEPQPYYEALTAEPHAPRIFIVVPAWSKDFPHSESTGTRFAWQVTLGQDIPVWGKASETTGGRRNFRRGHWGFGIWAPVSFHMIEDFNDDSNPIVDTDYRFGATLKLAYGLADSTSLNVKYIPFAHESTHLGDEYTIIASRSPGFERINVSYEYQQYGVSVTRIIRNGTITVRHGGTILWGDDGYYSNHLLGSQAPTLTPSVHNYEPSVGAEWHVPQDGLNPLEDRQWVISGDLRWRLQYDYHQNPVGNDNRRPSLSLSVGRALTGRSGIGLEQYFVYFYRGVNPYGQLRSQNSYWAAGLGWIFQ